MPLLFLGFLLNSGSLHAAPADAREVARLNNCPPKKIEVFQQSMGSDAKTVYRVTCNLPKATDKEAATGPDAALIQCAGSLCEMLRTVTIEK